MCTSNIDIAKIVPRKPKAEKKSAERQSKNVKKVAPTPITPAASEVLAAPVVQKIDISADFKQLLSARDTKKAIEFIQVWPYILGHLLQDDAFSNDITEQLKTFDPLDAAMINLALGKTVEITDSLAKRIVEIGQTRMLDNAYYSVRKEEWNGVNKQARDLIGKVQDAAVASDNMDFINHCFGEKYFTKYDATGIAINNLGKPNNIPTIKYLLDVEKADRGEILSKAIEKGDDNAKRYIESRNAQDRFKVANWVVPPVVGAAAGGATFAAAYFLSTAFAVQLAVPLAAFAFTALATLAIMKFCEKVQDKKVQAMEGVVRA